MTFKKRTAFAASAWGIGLTGAIGLIQSAQAADIHVNPGASIPSAINSANPGDRVLVHAGTYAGGGWIERSGTASAPITVLSVDGPRQAVIQGGGESLRVGNSSYMVFDGFEVRNSSDNAAHVDSGSHHLTFRNMYIHDAGLDGDVFKLNQSHHITIENSEFARPGARTSGDNPSQECLDFVDVDDSVIRNNYFHESGAMLMFVKGGARNVVIEGNVYSQQSTGSSDPMVGLGGATDIELLQGEQYEGFNITFRNNIVMNATMGAVGVYDANGVYIANNLFLNNNRVIVEFRAGNGPASESNNVQMVDNLIVDTRGQMPTPYMLSSHGLRNFTTSNNLYWNNGASIPTSNIINVSTQPGNLMSNPLVSVPSATANRSTIITTTRPASGSPAAGSGMDSSVSPFFVTTDITGANRTNFRDRGPFALAGGTTPSPTPTPTPSPTPKPTPSPTPTPTPSPTPTVGKVRSVSFSANPNPGIVSRSVTITASSTGSTNPQYRFWTINPSGTWILACGDYASRNTCTFTPNVTGKWQIAISARDPSTTTGYDATTNGVDFNVVNPPANKVTSVDFSASPNPGRVNQTVKITATSAGSSNPLYRFWTVSPSGKWTLACGDYASRSTCSFIPNATGTWKIAVSAKDASSTTTSYDATTDERAFTVNP